MNKKELKKLMKEVQEEEKSKGDKEDSKDKKVEAKANVDEMVDELADKITSAIKEAKGYSEKDTKDLKTKFFSAQSGLKAIEYPETSKLNSLKKEEKILVFWKSLLNYKEDAESNRVFKALVEGTDAEGGYLVPEEFRAEVMRILPDVTVMRNWARVIPMNTDTLNLNTLTARPEAYWTSEYAKKTTSSAEFGRVTLSPNKLVCLLPVTQELVADANIDLVRFIVQLFAERIGEKEDEAFFIGSGSGQPSGINGESLTEVDAAGTPTFDDVVDLITSPPQSVRNSRRSAIMAHKDVIAILRKLKDSNNNYIWSPGDPNNGTPERLYNYPIVEVNHLPDTLAIFGDWSYYLIGDRQELTVMTTTEGGDAWRRDSVEIKSKIRVDGKVALTNSFRKLVRVSS